MLLRQEYPWVLHNLYRDRTYQIQDLSDTGIPVGTTGLIQIQNLSDTGIPVGTTRLIQRQNLSDTGLIRYWTELIRIQEYP